MIPFRLALFDTTFDRFITKRVARVVWVLAVIIAFAAGLVGFFFCINLSGLYIGNQEALMGLFFLGLGILGVPLATFLALVITRLSIEASVALVSIAENTLSMRSDVPESLPEADSGFSKSKTTQGRIKTGSPNRLTHLESPVVSINPDQARFTPEDINLMITDFAISPDEFALDVLGATDHVEWVQAGKPDLKPWILLGLPNFQIWLGSRKK